MPGHVNGRRPSAVAAAELDPVDVTDRSLPSLGRSKHRASADLEAVFGVVGTLDEREPTRAVSDDEPCRNGC